MAHEHSLKKVPCVIVEDDAGSRLILEHFIAQEVDLDLVASIGNGDEAYGYLLVNPHVRIMYLDIQMPGRTGMDLLRILPQDNYLKTILTTSSKEFAVDAFELDVVDYMIKPYNQDRFRRATNRARRALALDDRYTGRPKEIFLKAGSKLMRIMSNDILYVEALSDYVLLFTTDGQKHIIHSTLRDLDQKLGTLGFVRVHRSYIVNLHMVQEVVDHQVRLGEYSVPISKSYQDVSYKTLRTYS
jgi:two-component system, LytTR family, response regulator